MNSAEIILLEELKNDNDQLKNENKQLQQAIAHLNEQVEWFKRQIFGKRSEKIVQDAPGTLYLFDIDKFKEPQTKAEDQKIEGHTRRKPNRNGQDKIDLPDLPIETTVLDLPEDEKICPETGKSLVKIGEEVTDKLAQKPASFFIKRTVRPKYATPGNEEAGIQIAELPDSIISKCRADESFLAHLLTQKFADHLPLYRISAILDREDIHISRKLLSQWVVKIGLALKPLGDLMLEKILTSKNAFIDESPVTFFDDKSKKGYMWVVAGGEGPNPPYRSYFFREDRRHDNVVQILKDYRGVLHSDKYGAYESLAQKKQIIWCPCFAHIRRKFFEAETGDPPFREWVLSQIQDLFHWEEKARALPENEKQRIRLEQEVPIIDELILKIKERMFDGKILPKSKFKEALGYFISLTPYLKNYIQYPNARLDNNVAERAIRPLAIGRKNWLFFGSVEAGEAAATLISLVQTCRNLEINPREYLEFLLREFMSHNAQKLDELLPDQWVLRHQANS